MNKVTSVLITVRISEAHDLAYKAYNILDELSNDIDVLDVDADTLAGLVELADNLQSSLYDFLNRDVSE